MKKKLARYSSRVDLQVMLLVAYFTLIMTIFTSSLYWNFTFNVLMDEYSERVYALYNSVETVLDPDSFRYINTPDDMETDLYKKTLTELLMLKNASGVMYLYTAKVNADGDFVYVVDGLESHLDFRYPNDTIEEEITQKMHLALSDSHVMPTNFLHTDWGDIFVSYLPVHDVDGSVLGVVGIEFDATSNYATYVQLKYITSIVAFFVIVLESIFAMLIFRRISNPLYLNKANIDSPTGLKNRNAYETDLHNIIVRNRSSKYGVMVIDINGLKEVNDRLGHISGDNYIRLVAQAILLNKTNHMIAYRTGGDEFVILTQHVSNENMKKFIKKCVEQITTQDLYDDMRCSIASGFSVFDSNFDIDLEDTFNRADDFMYIEKRRQKEEFER